MKKAFPGGIDLQSIDTIVDVVFSLGFNCVRLVYSLDVIYGNITVPDTYWEDIIHFNPAFRDP